MLSFRYTLFNNHSPTPQKKLGNSTTKILDLRKQEDIWVNLVAKVLIETNEKNFNLPSLKKRKGLVLKSIN